MDKNDTTTGPGALSWDQGQPYSDRYGDRYFDRDGLAESEHVFLRHNNLPDRWSTQPTFVVGELGFGTGLNACLTVAHWLATAPAHATLDYISIEAHPMPPEAMHRALSYWPQLAPIATEIVSACGQLQPGHNLRVVCGGRVRLLLLCGDAEAMLSSLDGEIDAWFLDGFSPARNPAMWSESVCKGVAARTAIGGSFATYTAAGWVRRNLQAAGFDIQKAKGFGRKREMLHGRLHATTLRPATFTPDQHPWFQRPATSRPGEAVVIGAGLAGCATARALAERGVAVTVFDRCTPTDAVPSRLPGLIVRPYPERSANLRGRFYDAAFAHTAHRLHNAQGWHATGVGVLTHRGRSGDDELDAQAFGEQLGRPMSTAGRWLPDAGWLDPVCWARHWLDHPGIRCVEQAAPSQPVASTTVWATGAATTAWDEVAPISPARGQMSRVDAPADLQWPAAPIAGGGLCIPTRDGLWLGSSHLRGDTSTQPDPDESTAYLAYWSQELGRPTPLTASTHATGVRAGTRDRMPQVGPLPEVAWWQAQYASIRHGRANERFAPGRVINHQWLHRGHGSRGATAALLCAEIIAAAITGAPLPVDRSTWAALHPGRSLIQALRQGDQHGQTSV